MRRAVAAVVCCAVAACGYTSQYRPPLDGRARAVWDKNKVRAIIGEPTSKACDAAVNQAIDEPAAAEVARNASYVPPPPPPGVIVYAPLLWYVPFAVPAPPTVVPASVGDANLWKGAIAALAIALVVLPIVDVALAASDPEDGGVSSLSIDTVNAYNDLARTEGSPCAH
jgi:hypothetical protein